MKSKTYVMLSEWGHAINHDLKTEGQSGRTMKIPVLLSVNYAASLFIESSNSFTCERSEDSRT